MKKVFAFLMTAVVACVGTSVFGATVLKPKKAAPVAKQEVSTSTTSVGASMLPTALNLVQGVMALSQQQKALREECYPTKAEITFVNNLVKEWANAGGANPAESGLRCKDGDKYESTYRRSLDDDTGMKTVCWDVYSDTEARGAVWADYPKVVDFDYCSDTTVSVLAKCPQSKRVKASNIWDVFAGIGFTDADFTKSEASQAAALLQKVDKCSDAKLAARRKAAIGGFVTGTISNLGQPTNTGSVMDAVTGIMGQKGVGGIGGLANIATQFLDK